MARKSGENLTKAKSAEESQSRENPFTTASSLLVFFVLIAFGRFRDFFGKLTGLSRYYSEVTGLLPQDAGRDVTPLVYTQDTFFTRRVFHRIRDCWDRPIVSPPASTIEVVKRTSPDNNKTLLVDFSKPLDTITCVNLGSYNYLGFADDWQKTCGSEVKAGLTKFGPSMCSSASEAGTTTVLHELEQYVAKFLEKEEALVFSMGYGTNTSVLSNLLGAGCLILSDSLNHTSIINGCRGSRGANIVAFKHNDMEDLESMLKYAVCFGQKFDFKTKAVEPTEFTPFRKILVVVEGIYSMEGEMCKLPEIVKLVKEYKSYLFVDEAHSTGALGKSGRGICDQLGVKFSDVDILMGTFSKSFAGMGGYVCGNKDIIKFLRANSYGVNEMTSLSPTVATQVLTSFKYITGEKLLNGVNIGKIKIDDIKSNSNYFRNGLKKLGCQVLGDEDSPVIPVMVYQPSKTAAFSRQCLSKGLAVVVVGYPAVPLYENRVRFCISAGHTKEQLKEALKDIEKVVRVVNVRYKKSIFG